MTVSSELAIALARYSDDNPGSLKLHLEASGFLPGGNTRSVLHNEPFPICILRGAGNQLEDVDGHRYIDFLNEMSAGIYGHSHPVVLKLVQHVTSEIGLSLGGNTPYETDLAGELQKRFPLLDKIRFCNSGTELNIQCLVAARHYTKKNKFICFQGGYHGGPLVFAHGSNPYNIENSRFIPCNYNNVDEFNQLVFFHRDELAGVIVEAMQGAGGCIPADLNFLKTIQAKCHEFGLVFILDEVMTSRLSYGGLQAKLDLKPDLTSLGKYIGGGFTVGAFGGRLDIMDCFNPTLPGHLSHSGTFNNNTMTMYVGHEALTKIYTSEMATKLNNRGDLLKVRLTKLMQGTKMSINGLGSLLNIHFTTNGLSSSLTAINSNSVHDLKRLFWLDMIEKGYWISYRGMISLSVVLEEADIDKFAATVEDWIHRRRSLINL